MRFPETLEKIMRDLYLHPLCEYLYDVATAFSEFYDNCYCVEKNPKGVYWCVDLYLLCNIKYRVIIFFVPFTGEIISVNVGRLLLCEVTASVMEQSFKILGIRTVSKM